MNDINKIMTQLNRLNQYAGVLKEEEFSGIDLCSHLISQFKDEFSRYNKTKCNVIQVIYFKNYNKLKIIDNGIAKYHEFDENNKRYGRFEVDIERIKEVRYYHFTSEELYSLQTKIIKILYRNGFFAVKKNDDSVLFRHLDSYAFLLPIAEVEDWLEMDNIEKFDEGIKRFKKVYPYVIKITGKEVLDLYEEVKRLALDL